MLVAIKTRPIPELCLLIMPLLLTGCAITESVSELDVSHLKTAKRVSVLVTVMESREGMPGLALSFTSVSL